MFKPVLFFISFFFASCTGETPITVEASLSPRKETAANIRVEKRCYVAIYKAAQFTIYRDGNGAAALLQKQEIPLNVKPFQSGANEWTAVDVSTGDYIRMNLTTGVTEAKIKGLFHAYLPEGN